LQTGASYSRLDGNLQNSSGEIIDVNRSSLQAGLGAGAVGAGQTLRPGVVAEFHLADALYQPKIVERRAWARGHAAEAALHDQLLAAGLAQQRLLGAQQRLALIDDHAARIGGLARLTADFADAGEGLRADADRLAAEWQLSEVSRRLGEEQVVTASARLSEAISAPPGTVFVSAEPVLAPIELVSLGTESVDLVSTGLSSRPELKEAQCLVAEACERLRRERTAPLVPSVLLGMTYGGFGGGLGDTVADFNDRAEFNALAVWQVRNLGFGEAAARREQYAAMQQAKFERIRTMDRVAREIVEAHGQVVARARRIEAAQRAIATAADSFDLNASRIREGQGLPIEALQSAQALDTARQTYLAAVLEYNEAQLRLYRGLGWPLQQ
jgi:outer membrane protein TolC